MTQQNRSYEDLLETLQKQDAYIQQLESKIAEQESDLERYQHQIKLLDFTVDAVIASDADFNITVWNKAAENIYGWTAKDAIGKNAIDLLRTQYLDGTQHQDALKIFKETGQWLGKLIHYHKDGTPIPLRVHSSNIHNDKGGLIGYVTVVHKIADENEAEEILRKNVERYRVISEMMSDYAYLYHVRDDGSWHRVWTTREAFKRVTGYYREEIKETYGLYHPDDIPKVKHDLERTLAGENIENEYRIKAKDGSIRWVYIRRRVIWDEEHQRVIGFYGAGKDITERKVADERLKQYYVEQERINILRNFIHDASHDFKTPLSTINTSIYILRKLATTDKQISQLDKLDFHIQRFIRLIDDMFEMSRLDLQSNLSLNKLNINMHLRNLIISKESLASRSQIQLINGVQETPLFVNGHTQSLIRAISNILDNAFQYTPQNGQIEVKTYQEDQWVVIAVRDTGIGIPPEQLDQIFIPFYRGDKARSANSTATTGLGLSIAEKIIHLHNGELDVESTVDEGSCFYIRLPISI